MAFNTPNVAKDKLTGYVYEPEDGSGPKQIVLTKKRGHPTKKKHHKATWYPEDKRVEAATLWAATRSTKTVHELTGVTPKVLQEWKKEPWFMNIVSRVKKEKNDELDQQITEIIHECTNMLKERLYKGNTKWNYKTGEQFLVPMDSKDLVMAMGILFDKRQLLRGEATSRSESVTSSEKLEELKQAFLKFSEATEIEGEYIKEDEKEQSKNEAGEEGLLIEADSGASSRVLGECSSEEVRPAESNPEVPS